MMVMMKIKLFILLVLSLSILTSCSKENISSADKAAVQGSMKAFVDAKIAKDNNVYKIEGKNGTFDYLHEGVKWTGQIFVSCADVKVGSDVYDIDYYVVKENDKYIVIKELLHKINKKEINRTLWEQ
jgi:ABC-type oligopeptide transport system substrate-binding subunit